MGGRLFEAGRLLTFSAFGKGAFSRWALIRINTVLQPIHEKRFTLGLSQPHPQNITGSCPFIIICSVSFLPFEWLQFSQQFNLAHNRYSGT